MTIEEMALQASGDMAVSSMANAVCGSIPEGFILSMCMENGAGWVELTTPHGSEVELDAADLTMVEQVNQALQVAKDMAK